MFEKIAVIGSGAWGTALAQVFATAGKEVSLYARNEELAKHIETHKENNVYLPSVILSSNIKATANIKEAVGDADIILMVVPTQHTRHALENIKPHIKNTAVIANCSKGIETMSGKLLSAVAEEILPDNPYAVLSGPSFAIEVARGLPTAVTLATLDLENNEAHELAKALSSDTFRPYISNDPIGAEIAGALKNVIAIACGIVSGKELGNNSSAAIMTRGMAEIKRVGLKLNADAQTFLGLSGIGDLTLTCNSKLSRNYSLGFEIGQGKTIKEIMHNRTTVAEGYTTTKAVFALAKELKVELPVCNAVYNMLYNDVTVDACMAELMKRHLRTEVE